MVSLHALVLTAALGSSGDFVLLDFGADWCVPCRSMETTVHRLEDAGFPVRRVNVEQSPDLARRFSVGPIPCFVLVQDGREVSRTVGATSYDRLVQMFHQAGYGNAQPAPNIRGQSPEGPAPEGPAAIRPIANNPSFGNSPAGHSIVPIPTQLPPAHARSIAPGSPTLSAPIPGASPVGASPLTSTVQQPSTPPPTAATTAVPTQRLTSAHLLALQATVRLRVSDATGLSKGTGTIIDVHGDEALVVTCGHIFRDSQGKGEIQVDLFAPGSRGPVPGYLLVYESEQRDFALVSIRLNTTVTPVKVANSTFQPQKGAPIFSVGCNHGNEPTVRVSSVSAINRYLGSPNLEIHGHPVQGRSGGGLFTEQGQIIGICNAAEPKEDRGIYAALPTIHLALDRIGQGDLYLNSGPGGAALAVATDPNPAPTVGSISSPPEAMAMLNPAARRTTPAATASLALNEVICIVRLSDGSTRVMVVKDPSSKLLNQLATESQQQPLPGRSALPQRDDLGIARLSELPSPSGPVVRGQGAY